MVSEHMTVTVSLILGFDKDWLNSLRKAILKDHIGIDIRVPEEQAISLIDV